MRTLHGHATTAGNSPTYASWRAMRDRCSRSTHKAYPAYGGRGIEVCARWQSFEAFLADMGERPPGTTLDRIDNNGNYEPGNCRWATAKVQGLNTRANRIIAFRDERMTLREWSQRLGLKPTALRYRLAHWSLEDAMTRPKVWSGTRTGKHIRAGKAA